MMRIFQFAAFLLTGCLIAACVSETDLAACSDGKVKRPLIVNEPAEHFFVFSANSQHDVQGQTEGAPNAFSGLWEFRFPPEVDVSQEGVRRYVNALAGENLTHLFINVNYQRAFYPSKVIEPIWTSLDESGRQQQPFLRKMKEAFDRGLDVYSVMIDCCREKRSVRGCRFA